MIGLIFVFLLAILIISILIDKKSRYGNDCATYVSAASILGLIIIFMLFVCLLGVVSSGSMIDSKIELYQTQNTEIESKIQATVASYLAHERQTYKDLKPDNAIAVVSAYPELHSNELVKKQIEVYEDNNKKIMNLKEEKLNQSVYKWWLYFGK
jgi:hypothetical protein|nr:MAG TPA: hypothetical protein [Caudoviricetes sp.]DAR58091.1 MAG TPA: hypothetical protein [Caudoviricetes sp.]